MGSNHISSDSPTFSHSLDPQETLSLPKEIEHWSLPTLRQKLVKIGAKVVRHGRYDTFQMAQVAIPRAPFAGVHPQQVK